MAKKLYEEQNIYDIACAIREKCGDETATFKTCDMADAIRDLEIGGGGGTTEGGIPTPIVLGNTVGAMNMFSCSIWNPFIEEYGDQLDINVFKISYAFSENESIVDASNLTFNVFTSSGVGYVSSDYMFNNCYKLQELPTIKGNWIPYSFTGFFRNCYSLKSVKTKFFRDVDWSYIQANGTSSGTVFSSMLTNCYSLRSFPISIFANDYPRSSTNNYLDLALNNLYAMDELVDLPIPYTDACYNKTIQPKNCTRISEFTFEMDEDDDENSIPLQMQWGKLVLDLTDNVGYGDATSEEAFLTYSDDFTEDNRVTTALTYAELKDDPDWWTTDITFSRYNHDSAVNTINSLPDTLDYVDLVGDANIIKFKSASGVATDGGPISALTQTEIAVAAAKGWTVTLVD